MINNPVRDLMFIEYNSNLACCPYRDNILLFNEFKKHSNRMVHQFIIVLIHIVPKGTMINAK
jgi:hypothetical protein